MDDELADDDFQEIQLQTLAKNTAIRNTLIQIWSAFLIACYGNSKVKKYREDNEVTLVPIKTANY